MAAARRRTALLPRVLALAVCAASVLGIVRLTRQSVPVAADRGRGRRRLRRPQARRDRPGEGRRAADRRAGDDPPAEDQGGMRLTQRGSGLARLRCVPGGTLAQIVLAGPGPPPLAQRHRVVLGLELRLHPAVVAHPDQRHLLRRLEQRVAARQLADDPLDRALGAEGLAAARALRRLLLLEDSRRAGRRR